MLEWSGKTYVVGKTRRVNQKLRRGFGDSAKKEEVIPVVGVGVTKGKGEKIIISP